MAAKGVIVEFDYTVLKGSETLFNLAKGFLSDLDGIALDQPTEARYLIGASYLSGIMRLFDVVKTKKTAVKAARELEEAFNVRMTEMVPDGVDEEFRQFVKVLADADVKVVVSTHADICADSVREAFADLSDSVLLFQETDSPYGAPRADLWRLICARNRIGLNSVAAVTGSGFGVRAALLSGVPSLAVVNNHVAYQDFGGADEVVTALDAAAAKHILAMLKVDKN